MTARGESDGSRGTLRSEASAVAGMPDAAPLLSLTVTLGGRWRGPVIGGQNTLALELAQGPIVSALLEHDIFVLFPVQPTMLARYRETFTPSRAKDDPTDAEFALELLLRYPEKLPRLQPESPDMRSLRRLVEIRRALVDDRVAITNRLTSALKGYFPQILDWFRDKDTPVFAGFLERWPTLDAAKRARHDTLIDFLRKHNVRRQDTIARRIDAIHTEEPLTTDPAVIGPLLLLVEMTLPQLRAVNGPLNASMPRLPLSAPSSPTTSSLTPFLALAPLWLLACWSPLASAASAFPTPPPCKKYVGVTPVTERSGNKSWVHWRFACPTFQRQTFIEWVGQTVPRSFWAEAFYQSYRERGGSHQAALRALAFKWIRILHRCWVDQQPYNEAHYLMALQKRHAPLLAFAAKASS